MAGARRDRRRTPSARRRELGSISPELGDKVGTEIGLIVGLITALVQTAVLAAGLASRKDDEASTGAPMRTHGHASAHPADS